MPIRENGKEILGLHEMPNFLELLSSEIDFLFYNSHPMFEAVTPNNPNTALVAGLHLRPPTKLPADLQQILDDSKHGIIFVSFGSVRFIFTI